jgi:hypothetical protein
MKVRKGRFYRFRNRPGVAKIVSGKMLLFGSYLACLVAPVPLHTNCFHVYENGNFWKDGECLWDLVEDVTCGECDGKGCGECVEKGHSMAETVAVEGDPRGDGYGC